jgi:hypothetical protein
VTHTKYPRTWHLPDSPNRGADGDHAHADYSTFDGREVVVTEKLDGENTTIYADGHSHARSVSSCRRTPSCSPSTTAATRA